MRLLLVTPPMTQLNTPYPATAYLCGFLAQHAARLDLTVTQADPALELFLRLYSRAGVEALAARIGARFGAGARGKRGRGSQRRGGAQRLRDLARATCAGGGTIARGASWARRGGRGRCF